MPISDTELTHMSEHVPAFTRIAGLAQSRLGLASNGLDVSERPLHCPHCGAGPFKTAGELQAHIDAVHGNQQ
jgi:hypothetical protein